MAGHPADAFIDANADWECGREGAPCRFGPDRAGRCAMRPECAPYRDGDRWICDRPINRGGACEQGPLPDGACCFPATPCLPRTTPKRKFKIARRLGLAAAFGVALLLLSLQVGLSPGPLTSPHAAFEDDCAQCHADMPRSFVHMAGDAFRDDKGLANSGKCLACHQLGDNALAAHGVDGLPPVRDNDSSTAPAKVRAAAALAHDRLESVGESGQIACNTCHRDHQGRQLQATAMSDAQCQTCHLQPFDGFAQHPPFAPYPHHLQGRIAFDHASHFRRHFAQSEKNGTPPPTGCGDCHAIQSAGNMVVDGFATCAACHTEEITTPAAGLPYLTFLAPPGIDLEVLAAADIGEWPAFAEAPLNEFAAWMLEAGGYLSAADLAAVADLDLLDLSDASAAQLRGAARLAWAFKALSRDLLRTGPAVFVETAQQRHMATPLPRTALAWTDLAASLPPHEAATAINQWFPGLADELRRRALGEAVATAAIDLDADHADQGIDDVDDWMRFGGWHSGYLALEYRPSGHADRFMRGWLMFATAPMPRADALFDLLTDQETPGNCAKCHVAASLAEGGAEHTDKDAAGNGNLARLSWSARGNPEAPPRNPAIDIVHAARFSHVSHQQAIAEQGCASCHAALGQGKDAPDATPTPSGFANLSPDACASCHRQETGLASCASCHDYHFATFGDGLFETGGRFADDEDAAR